MPGLFQTLCKDWQVDLTVMLATGAPVSVLVRGSDGFLYRPNLVPNIPLLIPDPTSPTAQRINVKAFEIPEASRQGTLGRNTLRSSALRQVNLGIARSIRLPGPVTAQLRLDAFNVINTPNFGPPDAQLPFSEEFGKPFKSYAEALGTGTLARGGLLPLQQAGGPRSVQLGLRLIY
jgi:hypothetical protein